MTTSKNVTHRPSNNSLLLTATRQSSTSVLGGRAARLHPSGLNAPRPLRDVRPCRAAAERATVGQRETVPDYRVVIPEEQFQLITFLQDNLPGVAALNGGLIGFEPKIVFQWHLSLMIHFEDLIERGMPSVAERELVDPWQEELEAALTTPIDEKVNAIFLARITWNATRELVYRVYDPEPSNTLLQGMIASKNHPRPFDFRIDPDPEWKLAEWHLNAAIDAKAK